MNQLSPSHLSGTRPDLPWRTSVSESGPERKVNIYPTVPFDALIFDAVKQVAISSQLRSRSSYPMVIA